MSIEYERDANGAHKIPAMTLKRAAQMALDVQDACNLSGVVRSFVQVIDALRAQPNTGTDSVNQHAICQLFASKIEDLTRVNYGAMTFSKAYDTVRQLADRCVSCGGGGLEPGSNHCFTCRQEAAGTCWCGCGSRQPHQTAATDDGL